MSHTAFQKIILWGVCVILILTDFAASTDRLLYQESDISHKNQHPGLTDYPPVQTLGSIKTALSLGPGHYSSETFSELCHQWKDLLKTQTTTLIDQAHQSCIIPKACSFQRKQALQAQLSTKLDAIQKSYFAATPWDIDTAGLLATPEYLAVYFSLASERDRSIVLSMEWEEPFQDALLKSARSAYLFGTLKGLVEHQNLLRVKNILYFFRLAALRTPKYAWPYALKALSLIERHAKEGRDSDSDYMIPALQSLIAHRSHFYGLPTNSETSNFFFRLATLTQPTSLAEIFHRCSEGRQIFQDLHTVVVTSGLENTRTALLNHMKRVSSTTEGPRDFAPRLIQNYMTLWTMHLDQGDCSPDILNLLLADIGSYLKLIPAQSIVNPANMTLYFQILKVLKRLTAEHGINVVSPRGTLLFQGSTYANGLLKDKKLGELCHFLKCFMDAKLPATYFPRIDYKKLYTLVTDNFSKETKAQENFSDSLSLLISYRRIFLSPFIDTGKGNYADFLHMTLLSLLNDVTNPKDRRAVQMAIYDEVHLLSKIPKLKETFVSFRDKVRSIIQGELKLSADEIHPPLKRYLETPKKPNSAGRPSRKNVRKR